MSAKMLWSLALFLTAGLLLIFHAALYQNFFSDDSFISLRYAERFAQGLGLTWNDGEWVEGYSNPLWVVLTAVLQKISGDWVDAARLLALLCGLCTLAVLVFSSDRGWTARTLSVLTFVGSSTIAAWMQGGLEQPLVALLLVSVVILVLPVLSGETLSTRTSLLIATLLCLLTLTRSDGALWGVALVLFVLVWNRRERAVQAHAFAWGSAILVVLVAHTLWRLSYYGDYVSNIAHIKIGLSYHRILLGLRYVGLGFTTLFPLIVLLCFGVPVLRESGPLRACYAFLGWLIGCWCIYLVFIGGDVNPPMRHFVPLIALLCVAVRELAHASAERSRGALQSGVMRWGVTAIVAFAAFQFLYAEHRAARGDFSKGTWERVELGKELARAFPHSKPLVAVTAAGAFPFSSKLPTLDMLGLNDRYIATHPSEEVGSGWIGHEFGDADYVLSRNPDIFVFEEASVEDPFFYANRVLFAHPEFSKNYREAFVAVHGDARGRLDHSARLWFRKEGGVLGLKRSDRALAVPAWWCATGASRPARVSEGGSFIVEIDPQDTCVLEISGIEGVHTRVRAEGARGEEVPITSRRVSESGNSARLELLNEGTGPVVLSAIVLELF